MHIVNPPKSAPLAYPICTYTYVIVRKQTAHAAELRKMIFWALTQGQATQYTAKLIFAPLSSSEVGPRRGREDAEDDPHVAAAQDKVRRERAPTGALSLSNPGTCSGC
jgi:hypothetical protein